MTRVNMVQVEFNEINNDIYILSHYIGFKLWKKRPCLTKWQLGPTIKIVRWKKHCGGILHMVQRNGEHTVYNFFEILEDWRRAKHVKQQCNKG